MKEKNVTKINLSTFFLIIAIVVIAILSMCILKLYNEKKEETIKAIELQSQVNILEKESNDAQEKLDDIKEIINSKNLSQSIKSSETKSNEEDVDNKVFDKIVGNY